jgi:hypothetical protein
MNKRENNSKNSTYGRVGSKQRYLLNRMLQTSPNVYKQESPWAQVPASFPQDSMQPTGTWNPCISFHGGYAIPPLLILLLVAMTLDGIL